MALIEKDKVARDPSHRGCIPTKALLHAAEIADEARESAKFGVKTAFEGIGAPGAQSTRTPWSTGCGGTQSTITSRKIDTIEGSGRAEVADLGQGRGHR